MRSFGLISAIFAVSVLCGASARAGAPSAKLDLTSGRSVVTATTDKGGARAFIFDTGSQGATILRSVVEKSQFPVIGEAMLDSPGGGEPLKTHVVALEGLAISGVKAKEQSAVILDDKALPIGTAAGTLGPTQWSDHVVEIDLGAELLTFRKKPKRKPSEWAPLNQRGLTEAEIEVAGTRLNAHIDTGNPRGVLLPMSIARQLGWADTLKPAGEIRTVNQKIPIFTADKDLTANILGQSVVLKSVKFGDAPFVNIGTQALRGHVIVVDNPNRRWGLRKSAAAEK